ncbi:unnamed protein product [Sphagnum jensenii]|uniref:Uncharacterized protein n=1 Tax=Sphagnum jensenii TaxID=128206 RepID=A0ABP0X1J9_9BRYO
MAEEYEETKKNSTVPEVVDQKQVQLGIADEQAHEENQLELGKSGHLPRGIASYNADAAPVAAHEDDGEELGEQQQQEAPDQYPASSGINGAQEAGTDFGPDVEPKHKLHSEDEPLPADGDYHDVGDDDDGGIAATGAGVEAAEVQRSSSENDTVTAVTHGHGEQETGLAAADEQPKVTDGTDVETPAVEEKYSTVEEDRDGGVNPGGVGDDGGDSTGAGDGGASTGTGDGGASTGAGNDEEPSFEKATEATSYGEEGQTAVPAAPADEQPSSQATDGTDVAETPAAEEKTTETETETNPVVVDDEEPRFEEATDATSYGEEEKTAVPAAADEQPSSQVTDGTDVAETPAAEEKPTETETETNPVVVDDEEPRFEEATDATSYGEEEKTAVPAAAADKQPSSEVTDGTDVAETPAAEEKPAETETETNPVVVDDKEPNFEEATDATSYGEEEKTAVPAAAADEQPSSEVTDGTDVAETPAAEEKPAETETETNPVVDGDTPTPTTTPATPPTTNTTEEEEEPHKKEGFFSKFKDTVTFHHHHKSAETDKEGLFAKLKDKVTFHHHHPTKSVEENNTSSDNVTPKEVTSH